MLLDNGIELALALLMSLLAVAGWLANILGLPGNWFVVVMAALCFWLRPAEAATYVGWFPLAALVFVALLGEVLEFMAGALGASRQGGSRRGTLLAILGSIAGAIAGLFVGNVIPIPIIGPLIASILFGACGAFGGAVAGERWVGKDWDSSFQVGSAAFWGRLLGTVGKAVCGTVVCGIFLSVIWL